MSENYLVHRDHKYIDRKMGKNGKWQYTYAMRSTVKKKAQVSPEYQAEVAYNSQQNVYPGQSQSKENQKPAQSQNNQRPKSREKNVVAGRAEVTRKSKISKVKIASDYVKKKINDGKEWLMRKIGG